jgi:hypothetical protein
MYFCTDTDLLTWEPGLFFEDAFAHQAILRDAPATLTGTALVTADPLLGNVVPGMVVAATLGDDAPAQLLEVVAVADASHATVSALRGRTAEPPIPALAGGAVTVAVRTFRPQIAAVGDGLLALVGVTADRDSSPPALTDLAGFRLATVFGTLAAVFRALATAPAATSLTVAKKNFYDGLARATRRALAATVDTDDDAIPDTRRAAALPTLERV